MNQPHGVLRFLPCTGMQEQLAARSPSAVTGAAWLAERPGNSVPLFHVPGAQSARSKSTRRKQHSRGLSTATPAQAAQTSTLLWRVYGQSLDGTSVGSSLPAPTSTSGRISPPFSLGHLPASVSVSRSLGSPVAGLPSRADSLPLGKKLAPQWAYLGRDVDLESIASRNSADLDIDIDVADEPGAWSTAESFRVIQAYLRDHPEEADAWQRYQEEEGVDDSGVEMDPSPPRRKLSKSGEHISSSGSWWDLFSMATSQAAGPAPPAPPPPSPTPMSRSPSPDAATFAAPEPTSSPIPAPSSPSTAAPDSDSASIEEPEFTPEMANTPLNSIITQIAACADPAGKFALARKYAISRWMYSTPLTEPANQALWAEVPWEELPLLDLDFAFDTPGVDRATLLDTVMRRVDRDDGAAVVTVFTPEVFREVVDHANYGRPVSQRWTALETLCAVSSYIRNRKTLPASVKEELWGFVRLAELTEEELDMAIAWGVPAHRVYDVARAKAARTGCHRPTAIALQRQAAPRWADLGRRVSGPMHEMKIRWDEEVVVLGEQ